MTKVKYIIIACLFFISAPAYASPLCDQMRSYGGASWEAYNTGTTKSELRTKARQMAGGENDIYSLLRMIIDTATKEDSRGDAMRETYKVCKRISS